MSNRRSSVGLNDIRLPPGAVKGLTVKRLKAIQDEESTFYEFFEGLDLDDISTVQKRRTELTERNRELAENTAELEPKFEELKTQLRQKAIEAAELKADYQKKFDELKAISNSTDSSAILKDMQKAARDTEQSSEELADKFVAGQLELTVEDWVKQLQEQRQLYWLRKVKAEKMDELVKRKRPQPVPRSPRGARATESVNPPYLAPLGPQSPAQSLPPHLHPQSYPPDPRRTSDPATSLPPYPQTSSMPQPPVPPGHPFPRAAFTPYAHSAPRNPGYYPGQPPPRPPPYSGGRSPYSYR